MKASNKLNMKKVVNINEILTGSIKMISIDDEGLFDINLMSDYIKVELQNRKKYIFNPKIADWELNHFNDKIQ